MDVVVEVGDWEHACCGEAFERDAVVDLTVIRYLDADGQEHLSESHHFSAEELAASNRRLERLSGRVIDIAVVHDDGSTEPIRRIPSGRALTGFDESDDGHLEAPWDGSVNNSESQDFLVTIRV